MKISIFASPVQATHYQCLEKHPAFKVLNIDVMSRLLNTAAVNSSVAIAVLDAGLSQG